MERSDNRGEGIRDSNMVNPRSKSIMTYVKLTLLERSSTRDRFSSLKQCVRNCRGAEYPITSYNQKLMWNCRNKSNEWISQSFLQLVISSGSRKYFSIPSTPESRFLQARMICQSQGQLSLIRIGIGGKAPELPLLHYVHCCTYCITSR